MDKLRLFIKLLNSKQTKELFVEFYNDNAECISSKWRDETRFITFLKAYFLDRYLESSDNTKDLLFNELKDGDLNVGILEPFIDLIRGSEANVNDNLEGVELTEFSELYEYLDDPIYEFLSSNNKYIRDFTIRNNGFIPLAILESGNYYVQGNYKLSKKEISTIKFAKLMAPIISLVHSKYDELDTFDERTICNYNAIEDEQLKKLVPHTDNDNPEIEVLFPDGTIINYFKGDIRLYPFDMKLLVEYIKLMFVYNYRNADENPLLKFRIETEDIDLSKEVEDFTEEEFETLLSFAADMATDTVRSLTQIYSERMIKSSKDKVKALKQLVLKYKL